MARRNHERKRRTEKEPTPFSPGGTGPVADIVWRKEILADSRSPQKKKSGSASCPHTLEKGKERTFLLQRRKNAAGSQESKFSTPSLKTNGEFYNSLSEKKEGKK